MYSTYLLWQLESIFFFLGEQKCKYYTKFTLNLLLIVKLENSSLVIPLSQHMVSLLLYQPQLPMLTQ